MNRKQLCWVSCLLALVWATPTLATDDHVVISEACVTPTDGEFIEIFNPTAGTIDLSNYYLTDRQDYGLVPGAFGAGPPPGSVSSSDFLARFPAGATIDSCEVIVVAFRGDGFLATYGVAADYEIMDTDLTPNMSDPLALVGSSAGLTNSGENATLFFWDGATDLVSDVDMVMIGTPSPSNEIADKTGVSVDGPDADTDASTYAGDAFTMPQQDGDPAFGFSTKRIFLEGANESTGGGNGITGDDETSEDTSMTFDGLATFTAPNPGVSGLCPTGGPQNDDCINALPIADGDTGFSNVGATDDGSGTCGSGFADIWYTYVAPNFGTVEVSTCNQADYDTVLTIYPAGSCPPAASSILDCNDDTLGCGLTSLATSTVTFGDTYLIQVGGFAGAEGSGTITVTFTPAQPPPANDDCADASAISEGVTQFDTTFATTDGDQPCSGLDTRDLWYLYSAAADVVLSADTCASTDPDTDTVLTIWGTDDCGSTTAGNELDCNDDFCGPGAGFASSASALVSSGNNYLITVSGWGGDGHPGTLTIASTAPVLTTPCPGDTLLTHSVSESIIGFNSIACNDGAVTADNSYWRTFDLTALGITESIDVESVELGIEVSEPGMGFDTQPITLRLYTDTDDNPAPVSELTLIAESVTSITGFDAFGLHCFDLASPVTVAPTANLVVEFAVPDATDAGSDAGHRFFIGSNDLGETDESYLSSVTCGFLEPTDNITVGVPDMHYVMNVHYATGGVNFIRGDTSGDGVLNALVDALFLLAFGFQSGPPPLCDEAADVDGNGVLNALADTLYLLTFGFQGGSPPPAPHPACGADPDPGSSIGCGANGCP